MWQPLLLCAGIIPALILLAVVFLERWRRKRVSSARRKGVSPTRREYMKPICIGIAFLARPACGAPSGAKC